MMSKSRRGILADEMFPAATLGTPSSWSTSMGRRPRVWVCLVISCLVIGGLAARPSQGQDEQPLDVRGVEDVAGQDPMRIRAVKITLRGQLRVRDLLEHLPLVESIHIDIPGNHMELDDLLVLQEFALLTSLTLTGDPFLSDEKFAAIGGLSQLRSLKMALP